MKDHERSEKLWVCFLLSFEQRRLFGQWRYESGKAKDQNDCEDRFGITVILYWAVGFLDVESILGIWLVSKECKTRRRWRLHNDLSATPKSKAHFGKRRQREAKQPPKKQKFGLYNLSTKYQHSSATWVNLMTSLYAGLKDHIIRKVRVILHRLLALISRIGYVSCKGL